MENKTEQDNEQDEEHSLNKFECFKCGCYFWVKDRNNFDCPNCETLKQSEQETKEFIQEQANENISNLLLNKPRAKQINKKMSEFVKGLK